MYHGFHKNIKQQSLFFCFFLALMIFRIFSPNQHIGMISEGSCDTEDWSNDAEN